MEKVGRSWARNTRAEKWPHSGPDPHQLHLSLVCRLLCCGPQNTPEGSENCPTHHWLPTPPHRCCPAQEMSAEGAQHREGQLPSQPQTVCPPPLREALQGPPFPDQQAQEQLLPCGCHPAELCITVTPPGYPLTFLPTVTVFPPLPWPDCH